MSSFSSAARCSGLIIYISCSRPVSLKWEMVETTQYVATSDFNHVVLLFALDLRLYPNVCSPLIVFLDEFTDYSEAHPVCL